MSTLIIKDLSKQFGQTRIFDNFNLRVEKGELVAIVGPSGKGKSTLLRCIAGLEKPTSGTISIRGNVGLLFQNYNLYANLNIIDNVTLSLRVVKKIDKISAEKIAYKLLDNIGISRSKAILYPIQLSGGQQQRVAIVRAMALEPELLLFDEPTSALDPKLKLEILSLIRRISTENNCATILVTHEIKYAKQFADRVIDF